VRAELWLAAAFVSVGAHVGLAAWIQQHEPVKTSAPRPPIEMELAALPKPPPPPKKIEPPPPPPPPPPKPITIKKVAVRPPPPAAPPPPEAPKIGISEDAPGGEVAVAKGSSLDGEPGTGNSDKPAPPAPPSPEPPKPAPPAPPAKVFVPIYQVTQLPKPKNPVQPEIPDAFRQAQREALVVVEVEIDVRGHVTNARVMRHADFGLDDAALAAAKQTEFEPALMGAQPVAVRYQIPYRFKVRG
jgi:periplasmic protein TonB